MTKVIGNRANLVITGVSSFVGCHLAVFFSRRGYKVFGTITKNAKEYDPLHRRRLAKASAAGTVLRRLDITDPEGVKKIVAETGPRIWVHHAGYAADYAGPGYDLAKGCLVNVIALDAVYKTLSEAGCKGVIITGSSAEYGNSASACREDDICMPDTPYGLSKLAETLRARQLSLEYRMPTRVARLFIPYGALDNPLKAMPSLAAMFEIGRRIKLSPCKKDFTYIGDIAKGYLALARDLGRNALFDIFNLCGGRPTSLEDLLSRMAKIKKLKSPLPSFGRMNMRPGEPAVSYGSAAKSLSILKWRPQPLDKGLRLYFHDMAEGLS